MTDTELADPCAHLRVGEPIRDGWHDDDTSPGCLARHPKVRLVCTRIAHPPSWAHIATSDGPIEPGQYVHADGTVHPANDAGPIGGVLAIWHEENR